MIFFFLRRARLWLFVSDLVGTPGLQPKGHWYSPPCCMQLCEWEGPRTPLFSSRWEGEWRKLERRMDTGRVCVTRWWVQLLLGGLRDAPRSACTRNDSCAVDPAAALSPVYRSETRLGFCRRRLESGLLATLPLSRTYLYSQLAPCYACLCLFAACC